MPIYGPNEAQHPDPFGDPYINGILDFCHGHTGPQGDYHFHFASPIPFCIQFNVVPSSHSIQVACNISMLFCI